MSMENYIDPQEILQIIKNGLYEVMDEDYDYFKDYTVYLSLEQEFIKNQQKDPKAIYVVLKMGNSSVNFGQTVLPITLLILAEQNKLDICQKLFITFVNKFNLQMNDNSTIRQIYESPTVHFNFEKVYDGFRSVLSVTGFFIISKNANLFTVKYKTFSLEPKLIENEKDIIIKNDVFLQKINFEPGTYQFYYDTENYIWKFKELSDNSDGNEVDFYEFGIIYKKLKLENFLIDVIKSKEEEIPIISFRMDGDFQLDSQVFYEKTDFTRSKTRSGTLTFSFTTFMLTNVDVINDGLRLAFKLKKENNFVFNLSLKNDISLIDNFKMISINTTQQIGDIPGVSMVFTN